MTADEFNEKYKDYLETNHYGLAFDHPEVTEMLDREFQEFIKIPGFKYYQIKMKFHYPRFYANGISQEEQYRVENQIQELMKNERRTG